MNQTQALAKAKKLLGSKVEIHVRATVPVGEERVAEVARRRALTEQLKALKEARDARYAEILKADAEYQRLRREAQALEKERDNLHADYHRRVTVYTREGIGLRQQAEGDNFDEALAALEAKKVSA